MTKTMFQDIRGARSLKLGTEPNSSCSRRHKRSYSVPKKSDANQKDIVDALRRMGCFVFSLHTVGKGAPDLLVACKGRWHLVEVKNGDRLGWKLTDAQKKFRALAGAPIPVLTSVTDAVTWAKNVSHGTPQTMVEAMDQLDKVAK